MDTRANIGQRLKKYREKLKLSQENFGFEVDLARNTIYRIENGDTYPSLESLEKICNYLKISFYEFIYGKANKSDLIDTINVKLQVLKDKDLKHINSYIDLYTKNNK